MYHIQRNLTSIQMNTMWAVWLKNNSYIKKQESLTWGSMIRLQKIRIVLQTIRNYMQILHIYIYVDFLFK